MKSTILTIVLTALLVSVAGAQIPDKYTNLKVLPRDITKQELMDTMKGFATALGVRCSDCHVEKEPGNFMSTDWASDDLENKETARGMMQMVGKINNDMLPAATGEHDFKVSCVTCHRGVEHPYTLDQLLLKTVTEEGVAAAEAQYRELREQYYGSGSYDFKPMTLMTVAGTLAEDHEDLESARQMVVLNLEMNPDDADSYLMLAQFDLGAGDKDAAKANIDKALELDPENRQAQRMLKYIEG